MAGQRIFTGLYFSHFQDEFTFLQKKDEPILMLKYDFNPLYGFYSYLRANWKLAEVLVETFLGLSDGLLPAEKTNKSQNLIISRSRNNLQL